MPRGASPSLGVRCTRRCSGLAGAFRPSPLVSSILVCRFCGEQQPLLPTPKPVSSIPAQGSQRPTLSTVGYAGVRLEALVRALLERRISVLIDCRWDAWSAQRGFDGAPLRRAVEGHGIAYRHLSTLGCAPNLRYQLCSDGDWDAFATVYLAALSSQEDLLHRIAGWARSHPTCLLSCEREASLSHRGLLATRLAELGTLQVEHLTLW